ncbi:MAG: proteasome subunit beta [Nanobdellota archaeon]
MDEKGVLKTGTTTVGIKCKDGVILAADKRATAGNMIVDKKARKVHQINEKMALTTAGTVSDIQLITKLIKAELKLKSFRVGRETNAKEAANLLAGMVYNNIRKMSMIPGVSHFLYGGADKFGVHLYDVFADGSLTNVDSFVSSGSGSVFAYGVMESSYEENLDTENGVKLAVKAINAALQRDSASGNGINVMKITKDGAEEVMEKELNQLL